MDKRKNIEIRKALAENQIYHWEMAEYLDISEGTFSKMLRNELPDDIQDQILNVIECVKTNKPYDNRFIREYLNFKKSVTRRAHYIYSNGEHYAKMIARGLDDAERRRLEGGWDLSI